MKAIRTMKAMRTAKGVVKTTMKATRVTAMGVRGEKDASFVVFKSGARAPFWYGKIKVFTVHTSPSHGRWRVYKNSPRDKVESSFAFSDRASMRSQWSEVVKLLKRINP